MENKDVINLAEYYKSELGSLFVHECINFGMFVFRFPNSNRLYCFQSYLRERKKNKIVINKNIIVVRYWSENSQKAVGETFHFKVPFSEYFRDPPIEFLSLEQHLLNLSKIIV